MIGTDLKNPNFVKYTEAFGAQGIRAETPGALRDALKKSLGQKLPTVIEIPVGELPSPWHLMHLPKVRD